MFCLQTHFKEPGLPEVCVWDLGSIPTFGLVFLQHTVSLADLWLLRTFQAKKLIKLPLTYVTDNQESSCLKRSSPGEKLGALLYGYGDLAVQ